MAQRPYLGKLVSVDCCLMFLCQNTELPIGIRMTCLARFGWTTTP